MNKYKKVVASALAAGSLLINGFMPVLAQTTIILSGNGTGSGNTATVAVTQSTFVTQSNNADVTNVVNADADTGGNKASDNTGGDVSIKTGDSDVTVDIKNTLNQNSASVDCCGATGADVLISGNGSDSDNTIDLSLGEEDGITVTQSNNAKVNNNVDVDSETGDNKAKDNTGGDVTIETGDASVDVSLSTTANANSAQIGGGTGGAGLLSARILGNGTGSDNDIDLDFGGSLWIKQDNYAAVNNRVDADAETGENKANDNTGGEVSIETGDADVTVGVDNSVNFNWADADCGCLLEDVLVKIADNGSDTQNDITAGLGQGLTVFQGNVAGSGLENFIDADADTGDNKAKDNTGDPGSDPSVETGDATTEVMLENSGNSNVYGGTPDWDFPELGFDFNFSFDLSDLLGWMGL
ncbi:MAG: SNF2 domain/helicase domain/RING finger domain-containing protein [Candidatus Woesebacteria bacterium GW2011_GWA1_33_30]|uniref:SNF2 domain/helicase domain/RING finger domain-containing protein n=1 Tax=Candidatus Woesebacteria bacterium GW2011_GWA2_33_28 TaxID=1618561 RepID=A0A0F9ZVJ7_9BACT|nr:MAG: SNF2 domain/helicase domain/RING finger domain-containing protein [Candidatus Woesebacteria bacterium GW2011_GWA2_33_28]KKP49011.1 MAG: SNF2 domain/helicase domain/RING finger domain-containing protein [Candidatus Woesebacteria bacterium GW2011_GWA1_33_30]KKP49881.1 MAG: SNF2 domain/helicase domain/RING finger domain-containing protein [Microgenomates group bacterium GW2011_GWC1_33_32]KKP52603.1 MAG: SNF2 domain/helicase domain/RING finger domain-containing protein [Candidatus Woesebacte